MQFSKDSGRDESAIAQFWDWWRAHRLEVLRAAKAGQVALHTVEHLLSSGVAPLGDVAWEFGPGRKKQWQLVVSPNGLRETLPLTMAWAKAAPDDPAVEFAKPPKEGAEESLVAVGGGMLDLSELRYSPTIASNGLVDLVTHHPKFRRLPEDDRFLATFVALDSILGEMTVITQLGAIEPVTKPARNMIDGAGLRSALAQTQPPRSDGDSGIGAKDLP